MKLNIEDSKALDDFKKASKRFDSLYSFSLNLNTKRIGDNETKFLFNLISNILNLSRIKLSFTRGSVLSFEAKSLLSPLAKIVNLSSVSVNLDEN